MWMSMGKYTIGLGQRNYHLRHCPTGARKNKWMKRKPYDELGRTTDLRAPGGAGAPLLSHCAFRIGRMAMDGE